MRLLYFTIGLALLRVLPLLYRLAHGKDRDEVAEAAVSK